MTEGERFLALLVGVLVLIIAVIGGWTRRGGTRFEASTGPIVGRSIKAIRDDPAGDFGRIRRSSTSELEEHRRGGVEFELDRELSDVRWPGPWRSVVIHPVGEAQPEIELEEGPPWHLVVDREGHLHATERLRKGRQGCPPWFSAASGRRAMHVLVLAGSEIDEDRRRQLGDLMRYLCRRQGVAEQRVHLATEAGASGPPLADAVTRATLLPKEWQR